MSFQLNPLMEGKIGKLLSGNGVNNMAGSWKVKRARKAIAKGLKDARRGIERVDIGPFHYTVNHGTLKGSNKARDIQNTLYNDLLGNKSFAVPKKLTKVM